MWKSNCKAQLMHRKLGAMQHDLMCGNAKKSALKGSQSDVHDIVQWLIDWLS